MSAALGLRSKLWRASGAREKASKTPASWISPRKVWIVVTSSGQERLYFYDHKAKGYTSGFTHITRFGSQWRTMDIWLPNWARWRLSLGATTEQGDGELGELMDLGIGVVDSKERYLKGYCQVVRLYDRAGAVAGGVYVTSAGPDIAHQKARPSLVRLVSTRTCCSMPDMSASRWNARSPNQCLIVSLGT